VKIVIILSLYGYGEPDLGSSVQKKAPAKRCILETGDNGFDTASVTNNNDLQRGWGGS